MAYSMDWWRYAKSMIRRYPQHCADLAELRRTSVTANYSGMPHGRGRSNPTENAVTRELPRSKQREYKAVHSAVEQTKALPDGMERLKLIDAIYWRKTHTLSGAALDCYVSLRTAQEWHRQFIHAVARAYGLED